MKLEKSLPLLIVIIFSALILIGGCEVSRSKGNSNCLPKVTGIIYRVPKDAAKSYASNLKFSNPEVSVNPEDTDELLISLDVENCGDKDITYLNIWAEFLDHDGEEAADEGELLAHDGSFGDNNTPILAKSKKRAIIELDSPEDWTGGKMVITIRGIETREPKK